MKCAIYCRKSTERGLDQDFNSLDAQREAGENYVASQKADGWTVFPTQYQDGGFSSANTSRPGFQALMEDVRAGKVDAVVVYKIDRLSRSLLDFLKIMEIMEAHNVSLVSVTQSFNSGTSMGRLMLNVLLSFAQFERETIAERVSDKMAAARRKGKYLGGPPILGYFVKNKRLLVAPIEAARVKQIFELYRQRHSLGTVARELRAMGWCNKRYQTRSGKITGGKPFNTTSLRKLLTNPIYVGKVMHKGQLFDGEHEAVVPENLWQAVQKILQASPKGKNPRRKTNALLNGLLFCGHCTTAMTHSYTIRKKTKRYRYYVCTMAMKHGRETCPVKSVSAPAVESLIVDQFRRMVHAPGFANSVLEDVTKVQHQRIEQVYRAESLVAEELTTLKEKLAVPLSDEELRQAVKNQTFGEISAQIAKGEERLHALLQERASLEMCRLDQHQVQAPLAQFDQVWEKMDPPEQTEVVHQMVQRITYDGENIAITFNPEGLIAMGKKEAPHE